MGEDVVVTSLSRSMQELQESIGNLRKGRAMFEELRSSVPRKSNKSRTSKEQRANRRMSPGFPTDTFSEIQKNIGQLEEHFWNEDHSSVKNKSDLNSSYRFASHRDISGSPTMTTVHKNHLATNTIPEHDVRTEILDLKETLRKSGILTDRHVEPLEQELPKLSPSPMDFQLLKELQEMKQGIHELSKNSLNYSKQEEKESDAEDNVSSRLEEKIVRLLERETQSKVNLESRIRELEQAKFQQAETETLSKVSMEDRIRELEQAKSQLESALLQSAMTEKQLHNEATPIVVKVSQEQGTATIPGQSHSITTATNATAAHVEASKNPSHETLETTYTKDAMCQHDRAGETPKQTPTVIHNEETLALERLRTGLQEQLEDTKLLIEQEKHRLVLAAGDHARTGNASTFHKTLDRLQRRYETLALNNQRMERNNGSAQALVSSETQSWESAVNRIHDDFEIGVRRRIELEEKTEDLRSSIEKRRSKWNKHQDSLADIEFRVCEAEKSTKKLCHRKEKLQKAIQEIQGSKGIIAIEASMENMNMEQLYNLEYKTRSKDAEIEHMRHQLRSLQQKKRALYNKLQEEQSQGQAILESLGNYKRQLEQSTLDEDMAKKNARKRETIATHQKNKLEELKQRRRMLSNELDSIQTAIVTAQAESQQKATDTSELDTLRENIRKSTGRLLKLKQQVEICDEFRTKILQLNDQATREHDLLKDMLVKERECKIKLHEFNHVINSLKIQLARMHPKLDMSIEKSFDTETITDEDDDDHSG